MTRTQNEKVGRTAGSLGMLALLLGLASSGCANDVGADLSSESLIGTVLVDGSSTVFPITEAVAEEFGREQPRVRVSVGISGTGGGFKKFMVGESDINDASRPIKPKEIEAARDGGIEFIELAVAFDGISVVVNKENRFVDSLTTAELRKIWQPSSLVKTWNDVRPEWPQERIALYGPGTDSGTFDYFTETINGETQACRNDFTASEDDNVLVQGVAGDRNALGFFGFAYYIENQDRLKVVSIDSGSGAVAPSRRTIGDGSYAPLSRPLFLYVARSAADRPEVEAFVEFYIRNAATLAGEVGYVALPERLYEIAAARFAARRTGTALGQGPSAGSLEELSSH